MEIATLLIALVVGILAAMGGGALSGLRIGGEHLGKELAAYMGSLYGLLSGSLAVIIGLLIASLI